MIVTNYGGDPFDGENIVPGDTSTGFTLATMNPVGVNNRNAEAAFIQVEANTINYNLEGIAATAAAGTNVRHALLSGESIFLVGKVALQNFRCIDRVSGSASVVKVTYYR